MKKLICEQDIRQLAERGERSCPVDGDTLITPSARDAAEEAGISFQLQTAAPAPGAAGGQLTPELICRVLEGLIARGRLPRDFCDRLLGTQPPYVSQQDASGLRIVQGDSVRASPLCPDNPRIRRQSLGGEGTDVLEIDRDTYRWAREARETVCVLEGSLTVTVGERKYAARRGDCLFIPGGVQAELSAPEGLCRMLCVAHRPGRAALE